MVRAVSTLFDSLLMASRLAIGERVGVFENFKIGRTTILASNRFLFVTSFEESMVHVFDLAIPVVTTTSLNQKEIVNIFL